MKAQRVYIDTSVLGGCFDPEFARWSNTLMADFHSGRLKPVISEIMSAEIADAPPEVPRVTGPSLRSARQRPSLSHLKC